MARPPGESYPELIEALRHLCLDGQTGTWAIATHDNRSARIGIDRGRIVSVHFQQLRGISAILKLRTISGARSGFTAGMLPPQVQKSDLPNTQTILRFLVQGGESGEDSPQTGIPIARIKNAILTEAIDALGPFAPSICEEHFNGSASLTTQAGLLRILTGIAAELDDPTRGETFKQRVLARLADSNGS